MTKKIIISQKDIRSIRSGVPKLVLAELASLKEKNIQGYAISEKILKDPIEKAGGIAIKTFRWPISGFYRRKFYIKQVEKKIQKIKPDLVIGHGDIIKQDICFIHNCVHLAYELIHKKPIPKDHEVKRIHEEILQKKQFKVLVTNSKMMKKDLESRFDLSDKKVVVHYPQINIDKFLNTKDNIREELSIAKETVVIGLITSGNFKKRNVKLLLQAVKNLETDHKLHILIAGKDKSEPFQTLLQDMKHKVTFLPPTDNVQKYYNSCDIFVLPAHIEEFGMSVVEAMACEKPVIVGQNVGSSEILPGPSKEFILQKLDEVTLKSKLLRLIEDQELRSRIGAINKETAITLGSKGQNEEFYKILELAGFDI